MAISVPQGDVIKVVSFNLRRENTFGRIQYFWKGTFEWKRSRK